MGQRTLTTGGQEDLGRSGQLMLKVDSKDPGVPPDSGTGSPLNTGNRRGVHQRNPEYRSPVPSPQHQNHPDVFCF